MNVIENSSNNSEHKIDTSLFVQKPYLRTIYKESNIEEDIDLKNQFIIKFLPGPISIRDACGRNYADNLLRDPSVINNNAHFDLNDKIVTNARFIQVNQLPQIDSHLEIKLYVDNSKNEPSLAINTQDIDFNIYNLTGINSIALNKPAENDNEVITKAYVDQFHSDNERNIRDVGLSFDNEEVDLAKKNQYNDSNDNKLTNLDSIAVNRNPNSDNDLANKKYIDDEVDKFTSSRFIQRLQNYLKVSVGYDIYNFTKYDKIQITPTTIIEAPNTGGCLLQRWDIKCNDKNNSGKIQNFMKSTKTNSPAGDSGAINLPSVGDSFMYKETSSYYKEEILFVSFERTDILQISIIPFYYNRFSAGGTKSMGRFRIQLLLDDKTWSTQYTIAKNTQSSDTSTAWTLVSLNFTVENYGIKLLNDKIDSAHADICFSNITITHSVY